MVGGAVLNAATFIGGNYLAQFLTGVDPKATQEEQKRHDLALEKYQSDYNQYEKERSKLLDWIEQQSREKSKALYDFRNTDAALELYNRAHQTKITIPKEPNFADYYQPSPQQKNGELLFIGASTLALGYAAFRFL